MPSVWIAVAATVIGAGISAYSSYESGKAQKAIAYANAKEQDRQAQNTLYTLNAQSAMQAAEADINFKMRQSEANARKQNAEQLEAQALQQDAVNRANLAKRRQEYAALQAGQRTAIAASGLVEASGTPLDLLAETAELIKRDRSEQHAANDNKRQTIFREADMERLGGELALQGATMDRQLGLTRSALTGFQAEASFLSGKRQAQISRMSGDAAKRAGTINAIGTIISGLGSAASMGVTGGIFPKGGGSSTPPPASSTAGR